MRNILITTVSIMALSAGASFAGAIPNQLAPHQHAKARILAELAASPLSLAYGNQSLLLQWSSNNTATVDQSASYNQGSASAIVQGKDTTYPGKGYNKAHVTQSGYGSATGDADNLSYIWQRRDMTGSGINFAKVNQTYSNGWGYKPNYSVILQNWGHDNTGRVIQMGAGNEAFIRQNGGASHNFSKMDQTGRNNTAYSRQTLWNTSRITQYGYRNEAYVNQRGSLNRVVVSQTGADILSDILQGGNSNWARVTQSGDSDKSWVNQSGNNNGARVIQVNASASSYVVQSGSGNFAPVNQ